MNNQKFARIFIKQYIPYVIPAKAGIHFLLDILENRVEPDIILQNANETILCLHFSQ